MAKKKVHVPKVVVQTNPPNRIFLIVLLAAAFVATIFLSYDFGRSQARPGAGGEVVADEEAQQRIAELTKENEALQEKVAGLQRDVRLSRDALDVARRKIRTLERSQTEPADKPQVKAESPAAETPAAPLDNHLALEDIRIRRTDSENQFRFSFSVLYGGDPGDQVVGTIWIAVNGMLNGRPRRLPLNEVSSNSRPFVKMDFRQRQEVEGELSLPPAFTPKNISIEAKPYSKKFRETAEKVDWVTSG
jgi:hypothetical protein